MKKDIDLNLFSYDTKINMEQLRGHIKNVKKDLTILDSLVIITT